MLDGNIRAGDWVTLDVTELVRGWHDGRWPNEGIGIQTTSAGAGDQMIAFDAHEVPYQGPHLRLIYATPLPTPTTTPTSTPTLLPTPQALYLPLLTR